MSDILESPRQDLTRVVYSLGIESDPETVLAAITDPTGRKTWSAELSKAKLLDSTEGSQILGEIDLGYGILNLAWRVVRQASGAQVTLEATLAENESAYRWFLLSDFAELSLYNLRSYVESGTPASLPEFDGRRDSMTVDVRIHATPSDVFNALIEPESMDRWISSKAEVEPHRGGRYSYGWTEVVQGQEVQVGPTVIVDIEPGRLLTHEWSWPEETDPTQVRWEIEGKEGFTTVTLTHSGFGPADKIEGYVQGWAAFLARLKSVLEGRSLAARA